MKHLDKLNQSTRKGIMIIAATVCGILGLLFAALAVVCERERRKRANHPVVIRLHAYPSQRPYLSDQDELVWGGYAAAILLGLLMAAAAATCFLVAVGLTII